MPNSIGATGLTTATQAELVAQFTTAMQTIYGSDINLASNTPDGQMMMIFIQAVLDLEDLLTTVYNMFDPDQAIGVILDQRVAINGIVRQAGTFTLTNVTLVTSQSLNLYGLDQTAQPVYTVADNAGNQWELQTTQLGVLPGTHVYAFQAANPGATLTIPNTITVPVTITLGVTSINNPTTYTTLGVNEESDAALKIRRQQSISLASQGYLAGLLGTLENISGVTSAFVYENNTNSTDGNDVPGHSIWVIVAGTGAASAIANAIYTKRNAGCGMKGSTSYTITQLDGSSFVVVWDDVAPQNMFITFIVTSLDGVTPPNIAAIIPGLVTSFAPGVGAEVNINQLATAVQVIDPNTLVTAPGFTLGQLQVIALSGVANSGTFKVSYNGNTSATINHNDSIGTIQTKVQAVTGLSLATVTGSISSQLLTFNLSAISSVAGLITFVSNSLLTVSSVAIVPTYTEEYTNTLTASAKNFQLAVSAPNIVLLPIVVTGPGVAVTVVGGDILSTLTIATSITQQFTPLGGYGSLGTSGTFTFSISENNSGGTITANSTGAAYTAGTTGNVVDTILVTDAFGNEATCTVTVT